MEFLGRLSCSDRDGSAYCRPEGWVNLGLSRDSVDMATEIDTAQPPGVYRRHARGDFLACVSVLIGPYCQQSLDLNQM